MMHHVRMMVVFIAAVLLAACGSSGSSNSAASFCSDAKKLQSEQQTAASYHDLANKAPSDIKDAVGEVAFGLDLAEKNDTKAELSERAKFTTALEQLDAY